MVAKSSSKCRSRDIYIASCIGKYTSKWTKIVKKKTSVICTVIIISSKFLYEKKTKIKLKYDNIIIMSDTYYIYECYQQCSYKEWQLFINFFSALLPTVQIPLFFYAMLHFSPMDTL